MSDDTGTADSEDERLLRETAFRAAADLFPPAAVREAVLKPPGTLPPAWQQLAEMGFVGLLAEDDTGGSLLAACIVAEALGSVLAPVPYVATAVVAAAVLRQWGGSTGDLERLTTGQPFAVLVGRDLRWPPADGPMAVWGWSEGASVLGLDERGAVQNFDVAPSHTDGAVDLLVPVLPVDYLPGIGHRQALGDAGRRVLAISRVGCAAALLGLARGAVETAVAYAKEREQYGRPIGSYQAVQHLCADMLVDVECSHSVVYGAARLVETVPVAEAEWLAATAKAWAAEAAIRVCENSIQVLGGIGVTWEHLAHLRLRGAHVLRALCGGPDECLELLGTAAVDGGAAR